MEKFDDTFDSVKAETLRSLVRDLGHKGLSRRDQMLDFVKNKLFGDGQNGVTSPTQSTSTAVASNNKKGATAHKFLSAPGQTRSSRKRRAGEQQELELDDDDLVNDENGDSSAKRTRMTRSSRKIVEIDGDTQMDSISAAPRRGRHPATASQSSSGMSLHRASTRTRTLSAKAAAIAAEPKRGRVRPRNTASAPSRDRDDSLSDADADGDDDEDVQEAVEVEEGPSVRFRSRGRPRNDQGSGMQIVAGEEESRAQTAAEEHAKGGRGRPRKNEVVSGSASASRTLPPSKKHNSILTSHAPMSTRSRTGNSPAKKANRHIAVPLVKRTYGTIRKGGMRLRGHPPQAAATRNRKTRSTLSKQTRKAKTGPQPRTRYIPARSRVREPSDRSNASASGKKYTFDGVELVSRNQAQQPQEAAGANAEPGPSNSSGTAAATNVGARDVDMGNAGGSDVSLFGGNGHGEGEAQGTNQGTARSRPPTPGPSNGTSAAFNPNGGSVHEAGTVKAPASGSRPHKEPEQQLISEKEEIVVQAPPSPSHRSSPSAPTISVMPPLVFTIGIDRSSPLLRPLSGVQIDSTEDIVATVEKKADDSTNDQEETETVTISSSKLPLKVNNIPATFPETFNADSAGDMMMSAALASSSGVAQDEDLHKGPDKNVEIGNDELQDLDSVGDDDDDTNIMDPPIGHPIEVVVHTEMLTTTNTTAMLQEVEYGLASSTSNESTENATGEPSSSAGQRFSAPLPVTTQVSIASLHSLHIRTADDDTVDTELVETAYLDDEDEDENRYEDANGMGNETTLGVQPASTHDS
ncbi:hypothetical protein F5050DRAFT_1754634 [Lentinula boryana]|uniref:Uncharacterized protein n=1 Tax=Lentinula boryana TaxID=40481 RepID=A0ABQ8QF05_9AGAR|nr:hypothetical protein F5050DRAFT_1754634 [Lentinula boryana]